MTTKEFVEKAIEGGWKPWNDFIEEEYMGNDEIYPGTLALLVLKPEVWQAVAKVEGWQKELVNTFEPNNALESRSWMLVPYSPKSHSAFENAVFMMAYLFEGRSIEQFLETL